MFKHNQTDNPKCSKKLKEVKLLNNYIPVKKANAYSNISEYETETSIQKNFSNKVHKNINIIKEKSVQNTHNNHLSSEKLLTKIEDEKKNQRQNKSTKGSQYNLNNLNLDDYFSQKILMTQQKFIDYKDNKINTLKRELSLIKKELNLYENKNMNNLNNSTKNKNMIENKSKRKKSHSTEKKININANTKDITHKLQCENDNNKILLGNNKSYISLNTFYSNEMMNINSQKNDKKLKKHLSNLLTENDVSNLNNKTNFNNKIGLIVKYKTKNKKNEKKSKKEKKDFNNKNLLSIIYLSKKGCFNHVNNNYDHNTKIINYNNNICIKNNKENIEENEIKHELHFFAKTMKERQMIIKENLQSKRGNKYDIRMRTDLQNLSDKMNNVFNNFFDYYEKNKSK